MHFYMFPYFAFGVLVGITLGLMAGPQLQQRPQRSRPRLVYSR
jgi:hypothetical protein